MSVERLVTNLNKMYFKRYAGLYICYFCIAVCSGVSSTPLTIISSPHSFQPGLTTSLNLNCKFAQTQTSNIAGLMSIIISKNDDPNYTNFREIATLSVLSGHGVEVKDNLGGGQVEGHISTGGTSYVSFQWNDPTSQAEGQYKCTVHGLDKQGHPVSQTAVTVVEETAVDLNTSLELLHQCASSRDQLTTELNQTKVARNQLTTELNQSKVQRDQLTTELNQSKVLSDQLTTDLNQTKVKRDQLTNELNQTKVSRDQLTTKLDQTNVLLDQMTTELNQTKVQLAAANFDLDKTRLPLQNATSQLSTSQNQLLRHILWNDSSEFSNYTYYNKHYYLISNPNNNEYMNVTEQQTRCEQKHGYLLELNDVQEYNMVMSFMSGLGRWHHFGHKMVLGIIDKDDTNTWTYLSSDLPVTFTKWDGHTNANNGEHCAILRPDHKMHDTVCIDPSNLVTYICEVPCDAVLPHCS